MARMNPRPALGEARRLGYTISVVINSALLFAVNRSPGWEVLPFLTPETEQVLWAVNASLVASLVANAVYILWDPPRLRALGGIVTTAASLYALVRLWQVFPFDFGPAAVDWALVARVVLGVSIFGTSIGVLVSLVQLVRGPRQQPVSV